jgi:hypothetical protein
MVLATPFEGAVCTCAQHSSISNAYLHLVWQHHQPIIVWQFTCRIVDCHLQLAFMEAVVAPSFRALSALAPNTAALALANIQAAQEHWRSGAVPWVEWLSPGHDDFEPQLKTDAA